ncbi:MAG: FGGY-family carbohydrate kinase [Spirochaetes bacterium]|nr:FGGY-family carbohydrate kinase [Spirochaetota bacterium]
MTADRKKYILAVDLGTSGPKSAIVSTDGEVIDSEFMEVPLHLFPGGGAEQDPEEWWRAIMSTSKKVLAKGLVPPGDIVAVACTTQWSGTVAVDKDGNHLMNAIIWLDTRGHRHMRKQVKGIVNVEGIGLLKAIRWVWLTGGVPSPSGKDPFSHILFIRNERPEVYRNTYKFLEPKDYVNLRFTGRFFASYDSIALHWVTNNRDINNIFYGKKLLKWSTFDPEKLPELKQSVDICGTIKPEVADELGLSRDVKLVMGCPDLQSAAIGSGAVRDYEGHIYVGTSSWVICHVPFKKTDLFHNFASLPSALPGRYLIAAEQETAGKCLSFLRDNILYCKDELSRAEPEPDVYRKFDNVVENIPPGSNKVIFTPWLYGERAPAESESVRAAFLNLSLDTTRGHMIRAVYEGVAYNNRWLMGYIEKFIRRPFPYLNFIGGGASSDVWCQIIADVLDRKIRQVGDPITANVRGAAFLASIALGYLTIDQVAERIPVKKEYMPDPANRNAYDELYREFVEFYHRNKKMYRKLNRPE